MKTLKLFAATIFLMTVAISGQAQQLKVNDKFGKPTHQELTMVQYDQDPEANAVVLCKICSVDYDLTGGNAIVIYHFQKRIKVLKDAGSKYANVAIDYYSEPGSDGLHESIEDLSAVAYNIVGGKLIKTKLSNKLVFNERLDKNHFRTKFTIPQVKVGTVIEYDYTIHSNIFFDIRNYIAQEEIPVAYCKYKMEIPTWFYFNVESSIKPYFKGIASQGSFVARLGGNDITPLNNSGKTNIYTFYGYLMPAVKDDPFVWCPDDYAAHVTSELMTYQFPGGTAHTMTKTWDEVDRDILEMDDFGSRLNDKCKFADEIDASGIAGISDFKNKVAAAFSMLMKKVSWDGNYSFIPKSAGEVLKKGSGSNADINMIFISMCNHLGIKACPVVMSTRRNGMLPDDAITKIKEVTQNCTNDKEKVAALYQMLGKNTRYVNLNLGIGGFQPMQACDVWRLGFGDCKALSNEMKAMLKVVGIPSHLVAIGLDSKNLMVNMPNFQQMDHMILEIPLPKDTCFVECTNTDLPLGYIHDFIRGHQALEISQNGGRLIRLPHYRDSQNLQTTVIHAELLSNNSVNIMVNDDFQNGCYEDRLKLMTMKRQEQQDYLLSLYRLPQAENIEDSIVNEKEPFVTPHFRTWLKANCHDYASITNSRIFLPLCPERADDYIPLDTSRKDSIIINEGYRNDETIIWHLPEGYEVESMPGVVDVKSPEANYHSNTIQNGRDITQHNIFQLNEGHYPAKDIEEFNTVWQDKSNIERSRIILKKQ